MSLTRRLLLAASLATGLASFATTASAQVKEIRIDYATYNPVSLVLKDKGFLEKELAKDGISVRWVQSLGSNKALEFLNAGSIDFGSTAGAAALIGKINGNPIKSIYVYSRPEWTALVTRKDTNIAKVEDLKGTRVAVTRGTDPHIFLVRALQEAKLTEKDVKLVLLQHPDGRTALERGDVDAWAGLDPLMAAAEVAFAKDNPALVERVLKAYEEARKYALANKDELKKTLVTYTKLSDTVIERQLERTELTHSSIGQPQFDTILAAGQALQQAGVITPETNVRAAVDSLIDRRFATASR
jgi:sulfonate transport system substrate-binding protein